eukprot:TRINITY_DN735_c0_g1_i2.p1 TRINITY_DN735_c0_g1~~TRINITY_DN735_c0_g1_i2.p1  ORF type:complete len:544 (+),score=182.76 TRINITY_DN735_c0_g1_i2:594-2225(+)
MRVALGFALLATCVAQVHTTLDEKIDALKHAYEVGALSKRAYRAAVSQLSGERRHLPDSLHAQGKIPEYVNPQLLHRADAVREQYAKVQHIPRESRAKICALLKDGGNSVAVLVADSVEMRTGSDTEILFRQESNFIYASGFDHPGAKLVIGLDPTSTVIPSGKGWLFVPKGDPVWVGRTETLDDYKARYDVDDVFWIEDFNHIMDQVIYPEAVYTFSGADIWGEHPPPCAETARHDSTTLRSVIAQARVTKTAKEMEVMRVASLIAVEEHKTIMTHIECGMWESDAESLFRYVGHNYGARFQSYIPIVGSGPNSAALHYNDNDHIIAIDTWVLVDAAAELGSTRNGGGYTSDITRTWPCSGVYTPAQKAIYDVVYAAQNQCIEHAVVGGSLSQATQYSNRALVQGLLDIGILQGGTVDEMLALNMQRLFMPHGLGHGLGLDVHDVGSLSPFQAGNVITCEPGIYFYPSKLDPAYEDPTMGKYLNRQLIESQYINIGGARIEDVIHITNNGPENLSKDLPRSSDEIQAFMYNARTAARAAARK